MSFRWLKAEKFLQLLSHFPLFFSDSRHTQALITRGELRYAIHVVLLLSQLCTVRMQLVLSPITPHPSPILYVHFFSYRRRKLAQQIHHPMAKRSVLLFHLLMQIPNGT